MSRGFRLQRELVRAQGIEPSRAVKLNGFSYRLRLSPPGRRVLKRAHQVCGLDYPFTVPRTIRGLGAARLVSTPSQLAYLLGNKMEHAIQAWLEIAISGFRILCAPSKPFVFDAGGGGRTRTELSLQRILSPLSLNLTMRNHSFFFFKYVKVCNFMCRF